MKVILMSTTKDDTKIIDNVKSMSSRNYDNNQTDIVVTLHNNTVLTILCKDYLIQVKD